MDTAYIENDSLLLIRGLKKKYEDEYQNAATVTVSIKDEDGGTVTGYADPLTVPYLVGSSGDYSVVLPQEADLIVGERYTAEFTVLSDGIDAKFIRRFRARNRTTG